MLLKISTILLCLLLVFNKLSAQLQPLPPPAACSVLGQTPNTAFPLCTKDTFVQTTVPICTSRPLTVPGCNSAGASYADKNPYWYTFTCYQTGTLGFVIAPADPRDDYDWQLYDVTGITDMNEVYTNASLFVVGNWSGSSGPTGAGAAGAQSIECASDPADNVNTFSVMPVLQNQHTYLMLISHFSDSQSGYSLSFGDGTAIINDPKLPELKGLQTSCDAATITVKLDTKVKCSSVAGDGSDFSIVPAAARVISATGNGCNNGFDSDSITLVLSNSLPPGAYSLAVKQGIDVNTLLDDCDRGIPEGRSIPFVISPLLPTLPDSISPPKCAPSQVQLVFKKRIRCTSIAADGSDFVVTGPAPLTITGATGSCNADLTSIIVVKFASPVVKAGVYQVSLKRGSDLNSIIDECAQETPVGASVSFTVKDTVSANFDYTVFYGCKADTIAFSHNGNNGVNQWLWMFDAAGASSAQNKTVIFKSFGQKQISLKVSNGFCTDSITKTISLDNGIKAAFETNDLLCPEDAAMFKNNSTGPITSYTWVFGNGNTSTLEAPQPQSFPKTGTERVYTAQLVVQNAACADTASSKIKVFKTCYIAVPGAFTPNGDGYNDYLYPLNAFKADNLEFNVYNRLGQLVFHTSNWTHKWDGTINGHLQTTGTYVWTLRYINHDTGNKVFLKGSSILIR